MGQASGTMIIVETSFPMFVNFWFESDPLQKSPDEKKMIFSNVIWNTQNKIDKSI